MHLIRKESGNAGASVSIPRRVSCGMTLSRSGSSDKAIASSSAVLPAALTPMIAVTSGSSGTVSRSKQRKFSTSTWVSFMDLAQWAFLARAMLAECRRQHPQAAAAAAAAAGAQIVGPSVAG
jgi:hypothetical protein